MGNKLNIQTILLLVGLLAAGLTTAQTQTDLLAYRESVWLTADRYLLLPGEKLHVQALLTKTGTDQPSGISGYVKLDLLGTDGRSYLQLSRKMEAGEALTEMVLPSNLATGFYKIRAYTNWMRNFDSSGFGECIIKVINPADEELYRFLRDPKETASLDPDLHSYTRTTIKLNPDLSGDISRRWTLVKIREPFAPESLEAGKKLAGPLTDHVMHLPETDREIIEGQVRSSSGQEVLPGAEICISLLNENHFDQARTDENGYYYFSLPGHSGLTDYVISPVYNSLPDYQIVPLPFYAAGEPWDAPEFYTTNEELDFLKSRSRLVQLARYYATDSLDNQMSFREPKAVIPFFHPPDKTVILDDYIRLANVREVIYEVVPGVSVRTVEGKEMLKVYSQLNFANSFETLVLLDGIPLINQDQVLQLTPDRIEMIEVKYQLYIHGKNTYSSIINFISPNRDYAGMELPDKCLVTNTIFAPPEKEPIDFNQVSNEKQLPDLRSTLHWQSLPTDQNAGIVFMSGDLSGSFDVITYGLTQNGIAVIDQKVVEISSSRK